MFAFKVLWATARGKAVCGKVAVRDGRSLSVYWVTCAAERTPHGVPWTGYFGQVSRAGVQAALPAIAAEMMAMSLTPDEHDAEMLANEAGFSSLETWYGEPIYPAGSTASRSL